jgi:hypothetical protein
MLCPQSVGEKGTVAENVDVADGWYLAARPLDQSSPGRGRRSDRLLHEARWLGHHTDLAWVLHSPPWVMASCMGYIG